MPEQRKLTKPFINSIESDRRIEIYDSVVSGMVLRVSPSGHKSYAFRYWYHGKSRQYTIGSVKDFKLVDARKKARDLKKKLTDGIDPASDKKEARKQKQVYTFSNLAEDYSNRHLVTLRPRTKAEYQRIIDQELIPNFGEQPASEISRQDIVRLLDKIAIDRGTPTYANRVRATLSSIFSFGLDRAMLEMNPVLHIKRSKGEKKRDRIYSEEEIVSLWQAFEKQAQPVQGLFKMLLICAQRSGETSRMKWDDIKDDTWTIPEQETKANRTQYLPLPDMAIKVLEQVYPLTGASAYVFASDRTDGKPITWINKAKDRIRKESGVKDFRPHDLRRTAASYMAGLGIDRTALGKVLNHKGLAGDDTVTAIYDRYDYMKEKRQALVRWEQKLQQIISGEKEGRIFKMG